MLCCAVAGVEVVNLHSPIAPAPELAKVRTHEAVAAYLAGPPSAPRVLCGDLNTPRREHDDGSVLTFAHDSAGRLRPERGARWDAAERALVHTLRDEHGWVDAYRSLHGYGHREASWTFARDRGGWRLDHVLVHGLAPIAASYAHEWRRAGSERPLRARGGPRRLRPHGGLPPPAPRPAADGLTAADLAAEVPGRAAGESGRSCSST